MTIKRIFINTSYTIRNNTFSYILRNIFNEFWTLWILIGEKKTLLVGSNANNSSKAGLSNFNSNNSVSNTNISFQSVSSFMSRFSQKITKGARLFLVALNAENVSPCP